MKTWLQSPRKWMRSCFLLVLLAFPKPASAGFWGDAFDYWYSGELGEDMLNAVGLSGDDVAYAINNPKEVLDAAADDFTSGRTGERILNTLGTSSEEVAYVLQNADEVAELAYDYVSSGDAGEDLLNTVGLTGDDLVVIWDAREQILADMGTDIVNGKAGERLLQFGGGVAQGAWDTVYETGALAWDGAAWVYIVTVNEDYERALGEYDPASGLIRAFKRDNDPGATTQAIVDGLLNLPAEYFDALATDPNKAGKITGSFLVPIYGTKAISNIGKVGKGAVVAKLGKGSTVGKGAAISKTSTAAGRFKHTTGPCGTTLCSIVDDLQSITKKTGSTQRASSALRPSNARTSTPKVTKNPAPAITSISKKISQKQMRHIKGRKEWVDRGQPSYLQSLDDAQAVLDAVHDGSATVLGTSKQGYLVVRVEKVTGFNNNPRSGFVDQATNVFYIKGSTKPSVVPHNPTWTAP